MSAIKMPKLNFLSPSFPKIKTKKNYSSLVLVSFNLMHMERTILFEWVGERNLIKCLRHVCQKAVEIYKENMSHPILGTPEMHAEKKNLELHH